MNDDDLHRAYTAYRALAPRDAGNRPSLEEMQQLVEGDLSPERREALLDQVLSDVESTRELAMLSAVSQARVRERRWMATRWWPIAAAAALIVAVSPLVLRSRDAGREQVFRAATPGSTTITIINPPEGVPLAPGLRVIWSAVPDADRYTLELISNRGDAIASLSSDDTTLVLPDSISAVRLRDVTGFMVVARVRDGGQRQSRLRLISTRAP